jgi:hypothetical protein
MRSRTFVCTLIVGSTIAVAACTRTALDPGGNGTGTNGSGDMAVGGTPDLGHGSGGGGGHGGGGGYGGGGGGYHLDGGEPGPLAGGLSFAVFGDCRPANLNQTSGYPSAIIGNIFTLAQKLNVQFVVGTGDYMFANDQTDVDGQVALFQQAEANFTAGPIYLTMGNHECTGATNSNCPSFNETPNVQAFMGKLLPSGSTLPYYRIDQDTPMGKAKFLFVAANAWSTTQQSWLTTQLADPTMYTFVVRHEPASTTDAPGVTPSEQAMQGASYTLALLGHSHEYRHVDTKHVISGNGGAPIAYGNYGLLLVQQQTNGNITVTEYDQTSGAPLDLWSVTPDGQPAP